MRQADTGGLQEGGGEAERTTSTTAADPAEELLREYPELSVFGVEW
jgi:hypothetical protein